MTLLLEYQLEYKDTECIPTEEQIREWASAALVGREGSSELVVRVVDEVESAELNETFRQRARPTNVLSFPSSLPEEMAPDYLGDLVICAPVVEQEARDQAKTWQAHWAHMIIHGTLHLQGYDHIDDDEAEQMEALEVSILERIGFTNPYETG